MKNPSRWAVFTGGVFLCVWLASSTLILYRLGLLTGKTAPGVSVLGASVSLKSPDAVEATMKHRIAEIEQTPVELYRGTRSFRGKLSDLGYRLDESVIVRRALHFGSTGSLLGRLIDRVSSRRKGYAVPLYGAYALERTVFLEDVGRAVGTPVRNAYWEVGWERPDVPRGGSMGRIVDERALEHSVTTALVRNLARLGEGLRVHIPLRTVRPAVRVSDIDRMSMLASFTTRFDPAVTNRVHNIRLAVDRIVGQYVEPNATWSLNEAVGPREESQGFKEAIVITEGRFVKGIGGGVSQVATTVFNAALLSDLDVTEHFSHTIPITYVPFGRDGTAVYGAKDLKVRNSTDEPISVCASVRGDQVRVGFYGFRDEPVQVELAVRVVERYEPKIGVVEDNALRTGYQVVEQEASPGYRIAVDRTVRDGNGAVVEQEEAATGWYRTVDGVMRVGTNPSGVVPDIPGAPPPAVASPQPQVRQDEKPGQDSPTVSGARGLLPSLLDALVGELRRN